MARAAPDLAFSIEIKAPKEKTKFVMLTEPMTNRNSLDEIVPIIWLKINAVRAGLTPGIKAINKPAKRLIDVSFIV